MTAEGAKALAATIKAEVHKAVVGQDDALDLLLVCLLCEGHALIEGVPGTAKTMLARCFAASLALDFGRIQFTPDLMPGDVLGTNLFNFRDNRFTLTKGPIFTQVLLADEINRTPPKTQAALLQAMQERTVTIDGTDHALDFGFMVVATQNPVEQQGTYPLPEAQLDRFLFKHVVDYPGPRRGAAHRRPARPPNHHVGASRFRHRGSGQRRRVAAGAAVRRDGSHGRRPDRLRARRGAHEPRAPRTLLRRFAPRRQHAGKRQPGLGGARRPRLT